MNTLKIQNLIVKLFLELFVFNRTRRAILKSRWAKFKLKKYVDYAISNIENHANEEINDSKVIWQYWHQGVENAPELIKKCLESVKKYHPDYEVKVLDFESINNYVEMPQKYYKLLESKKIPIAIFSDILRLNLLKKYGGVWIDSTIYLTNRLPDNILHSSFMAIKKDYKKDNQENRMSCYFIKSNTNNIWLNLIKDSIMAYWNENDYLVNYFMFEHIVTMIINSSEELTSKWNEIPVYNAEDSGLLQKMLYEKFDEKEFEEIKQKTCIHKLSYKIIKEISNKNTYYNYIIEDN